MTINMNVVRLVVVTSILCLVSTGGYKRVCYYSNWSQYRPGNGRFLPEHIDPSLCTHLIYSFAKLDGNHELTTYEWNDLTLYKRFNALKKRTDIKTLLAVGGWNAGSKIFSDMVSDPYLRQKFASQSVDFIVANGFDGLDMDWEYPANRGGAPSDKANFILLLEEIREAMKKAPIHLLLTAAVSAGKSTIDTAYDIPGMVKNLDFINLMSYDLHGGWENFTGHNSPLYSRSSENSEQKMLNLDWAANYWVTQGTPPDKLIIGLATYGRHFKLSDSSNHAMGAATSGSGDRGPITGAEGFLAYYEVCAMLASDDAKPYWHDEHKVPYLVLGDQWVGYDNETSFTIKLDYIMEHSYGGAMIWNIDLDDFNRQCSRSRRKYPLMSLMKEVLGGYIPTTSDPVTEGPTSVVTTEVTVETVTPIVTDRPTTSQTDEPTGPTGGYKRVCYYSNWSQYRPGKGRFLPEHIDPSLCTHLIYSFAKLDGNHELTTYEWNDLTLYKRFNALKKRTAIKTLLAVGGWNAGSKIFSDMVSDPYLRQKFASQSVDFIVANGFDGLDMDWEYPANRGGAPSDKANFILLLEEIREAMKKAPIHLLLTAAVSAGKSTIDTAYDIPGMAKNLDFINLMSYDLHGGWENFTGHNSPLYSRSSENSEQKMLNLDWAANYWVTQGTPPDKLIIGLATYGRHFKLSDSSNHAMGAATSGSGDRGPITGEQGFLAYYEVCAMLASDDAKPYWHTEHEVPYLVLGDQWVGYDNETSFTIKLDYIMEHSYGGAMIWNIDLDDFNRQCSRSRRKYPLMSLMKEVLGGYIPTTSDPVTEGPTSVVTTEVTVETVTPIVTDRPTTNQTDEPTGPTGGYKRVCYYSNWSQYRPGKGRFLPEHIDPSLCTHLIYSFAKLDGNHELTTYEWNDLTLYKRFNALKKRTAIKTLLAVGGWNAGSKIFSDMVSDPYLRQKFASQSVDFIVANGFDGLDMDWEYPANRGGAPSDKANFILLLEEIREAMKKAPIHLLLTAAVSAGKSTIDTAYDIPGMAKNLDFINLMSYDLHGGWENFTGHNSPLYSRSSENSEQKMLNLDWAANYWVTQGTPPDKLIIGLATYGRHFKLSDSSNHAMGAATSGSGDRGPITGEQGFLAYYEVCAMLASDDAKPYWHDEHKVPYLVLGDQWVGYDNETSFTIKLDYIMEHSYGGAMIWNIDLDDFNQQCSRSRRKYPLMSLMKEVLGGYIPTTSDPVTEGPTSVVTTEVTDRPTTSQTDKPTGPPGEFTCVGKKNGMYADPDDCSVYYDCAHGQKYYNECPPGLLWNRERNYCDYPHNVNCGSATTKLPTTTEPTTQPPTTEPTTQPPTTEPTTQPPTTEPTTQSPTTEPTTQPPTTAVETEAPANPPTTTDFCANKDSGLYKNVNDCQSFYHCVHHTTYVKHCNPGTLFNAEAKICDWEDNVNCDEKEPETDFCAGMMAGLYPFPEDCSKYYKCGGTSDTAVLACPPSTYYSTQLRNCDLDYNVNCDGRPEPVDEDVPKDICAAKGDGLHSDPESCHNYIQCANGVKYPRTCGGYLKFNPSSKVCDWPQNVNC